MSATGEVVGLPWYLREDYPGILDLMEDSDALPPAFADWLAEAEADERRLQAAGRRVARAIIDPFEFTIWCQDEGLSPDAEARERFAGWVAAHQSRGYR